MSSGDIVKAVCYRCNVGKPIGRTNPKSSSAVASAAYIAREKLNDRETGKTYDYSKEHSEVLFKGIFAPRDAPEWAHDRAEIWNKVQEHENRSNSQFSRPLQINLPHQLSQQQMEFVLKDFVRENFTRAGMVADVALHAPDEKGDDRNYHAHIMLTLRRMDENGFTGNKVREWNSKETLHEWREDLAHKCARMLDRAGYHQDAARWEHGHLSLAEQREKALERNDLDYAKACDREPDKHRGANFDAMQERGIKPDIIERREQEAEERAANRAELEKLKTELEKTNHAIEQEEKERKRAAHLGATLYDRAGMEAMQKDANRDHKERQPVNDEPRPMQPTIHAEAIKNQEAEPDEITRQLDEHNERKQQEEREKNYKALTEGGSIASEKNKSFAPEDLRAAELSEAKKRLKELYGDLGCNDNQERGEKVRERTHDRER